MFVCLHARRGRQISFTDGCEPPCVCWELNSGHRVLTTELSAQILVWICKRPCQSWRGSKARKVLAAQVCVPQFSLQNPHGKAGCVAYTCDHWEGSDRRVPVAHQPTSLAYLVSSGPCLNNLGGQVLKNYPRDCPLASIHT